MTINLNTVSLGYIGQRRSALTGNYLLGNGYRSFNPIIRRFSAWDSLSPFGGGGPHGYGYCAGDPVNQSDPSGQGVLTTLIDLLAGVATALSRNERRAASVEIEAEAGAAAGPGELEGMAGNEGHQPGLIPATANDAGAALNPSFEPHDDWLNGQVPLAADFQGLAQVQAELSQARHPQWHKVSQSWIFGKHQHVFGADMPIFGDNIREPLNILERRKSLTKRDIVILSGAHGRWNGSNWLEMGARDARPEIGLAHRPFFDEDLMDYHGNLGGRVKVKDVSRMTREQVSAIYNNKNNHVINGFCFGRNDMELRNLRSLDPVRSYMNVFQFNQLGIDFLR